MPTPCKLIEVVDQKHRYNGDVLKRWVDKATRKPPVPGDMFFAAWMIDTAPRESFSERYLLDLDSTHKAPLVVVIPSGIWWCLDQRYYRHPEGYYGAGWTWTGEPPKISALPSINTSSYHGTLDNGVLSDDLGSHAT